MLVVVELRDTPFAKASLVYFCLATKETLIHTAGQLDVAGLAERPLQL